MGKPVATAWKPWLSVDQGRVLKADSLNKRPTHRPSSDSDQMDEEALKKYRLAKRNAQTRNWLRTLPPERKKEINLRNAEATRRSRQRLTPEEREKFNARQRERRKNWTPEQRERETLRLREKNRRAREAKARKRKEAEEKRAKEEDPEEEENLPKEE